MTSSTLRVRCVLCCEVIECDRNDTTALLNHIKNAHPEVMVSDSKDHDKDKREADTHRAGGSKDLKKSESSEDSDKPNKRKENADNSKRKSDKAHTSKDKGGPSKGKDESSPKTNDRNDRNGARPSDRINKKNMRVNESGVYTLCEKGKDGKPQKCTPIKILKCPSAQFKQYGNNEAHVLYKRKHKFKKPQPQHQPGRKKLYRASLEKWRPGIGVIHCPECGKNVKPMIRSRCDKVSTNPFGAALILTCWPFCFLPCLFPPASQEFLHCPICKHFLGTFDPKTQVIMPNDEKRPCPRGES